MRKYHPDIKAIYLDGSVTIFEVKPSSQTSLPINEAKWSQSAKVFGNAGVNFRVLTEKGLENMEAKLRNELKKSRDRNKHLD